jgi:hypothetical protein
MSNEEYADRQVSSLFLKYELNVSEVIAALLKRRSGNVAHHQNDASQAVTLNYGAV